MRARVSGLVCTAATSLLVSAAHAQVLAVAPPALQPERKLDKVWVRMDTGLAAVLAAAQPAYTGFGIQILGLRVEFPRFALLLTPRYISALAPARTEQSLIGFDVSFGGRFMFAASPSSPYVGGGLTLGLLSVDDTPGTRGDAKGGGGGAYLDAGWSLFRSTGYQLSFGVRAEAPFYRSVSDTEEGSRSVRRAHYVVPLCAEVTISTHWPMRVF